MLHVTARTIAEYPLSHPENARRMWRALRRTFPEALACCLMGNHLHLMVEADPARAVRALRRLIASQPGWWMPPTPPKVLAGKREKVRRELRYILLNPCRARMVADPLEWVWSTHRDLVGASIDPWVPAERLAWLGSPRELHAYISADPSVAVEGTPFPRVEPGPEFFGLRDVWQATRRATRATDDEIRARGVPRRVFLQLARAQGFDRPAALGELVGCHRTTVFRAWQAAPVYQPALLCLHDARLRDAPLTVPPPPHRTYAEMWGKFGPNFPEID